jgi:DNA-binding IclR family transcriptional regulator
VTRRAPAVGRSIDILELLADRPSEALTLSEIARLLQLNKASCHTILVALTDRHYLTKDERDKTYRLGPAVLTLAGSLLSRDDAVMHAQVEMAELSRSLEVDCVASSVIDDEIVILAVANTPRSFGVRVRVGERLPLVPPLGTVFLAWASADRVDRWLRKDAGPTTDDEARPYYDALARVRERGYSATMALSSTSPRDAALDDYVLTDSTTRGSSPIGSIMAPVFDRAGDVALALTILGFSNDLTAAEIPERAERLIGAAANVSAATWGLARSTGVRT